MIVYSLVSLSFFFFFNLFKFKSILEAFIWGSVLGIRGKSPSRVEQEKRFWTTGVDIPYSISLKPAFCASCHKLQVNSGFGRRC